MKKHYIVKATPIVPSLCGIAMAVLWYAFFYFGNGKWTFDLNAFSFSEMSGTEIYLTVMMLVVPVLFFVGVLFLAEYDLRWMLVALLAPVAFQISLFVFYAKANDFQYIFENPIQFIAPFLGLILLALTLEKVLPTKWIFVGFCGIAVLLPLILTLCGIGEFTLQYETYDAEYNPVTISYYLWSDYLSYALYYLGLGALALQMHPPKPEDPTALDAADEASADAAADVVADADEASADAAADVDADADEASADEATADEAVAAADETASDEASADEAAADAAADENVSDAEEVAAAADEVGGADAEEDGTAK